MHVKLFTNMMTDVQLMKEIVMCGFSAVGVIELVLTMSHSVSWSLSEKTIEKES